MSTRSGHLDTLASIRMPSPPPLAPATLVAASLCLAAALGLAIAGGTRQLLGEAPILPLALLALVAAAGPAFAVSRLLTYLWRSRQLPGRGPADFLPLRWISARMANRRIKAAVAKLSIAPAEGDPLKALKQLARALERRDLYTRAHSGRVSRLAYQMLERMSISPEQWELARLAGLFHDMGKLAIPDSILFKPGPLDQREAGIMKTHPVIGAGLVEPFTAAEVLQAVLHHHERIDALGYPEGVPAKTLGVIARVISVCDTYDTLITDRPYRAAKSKEEAFEELRSVAGSQLDSDLVEVLIALEKSKPSFAAAAAALLPIGPFLRKSLHAVHTSTAPAAAAIAAAAASVAVVAVGPVSPPANVAPAPPPVAASASPAGAEPPPEPVPDADAPAPVRRSGRASAPLAPEAPAGPDTSAPAEPPPVSGNSKEESCRLPTGTELPVLPVVGCATEVVPSLV